MADDVTEDEDFEDEEEIAEEEIDPEELDEEALEEVVDFEAEEDVFEALDEDDDAVVEVVDEEEDEDDTPPPRATAAPASEDEDEDEDMLAPDDVEADLDTILKDRLVTVEEQADDDDDAAEIDDPRVEPGDRLQPKRADEQLCSHCFLLVRATAPACPMADDDCPIFRH